MSFVKFLRRPFYIEHLWWLLLKTRKVFMQKQPSKGFFKKGLEFARKHFPESPFFIKLSSEISSFFKNETLAQDFSCKFYKIRKNTFLQNTTRRLFLIIAVSVVLVMKGELASGTVNYDTKTMYQFEPNCYLLRSTLQVKQYVSEAVVRRFLKIS